jgi:hypothetical protein
VRIYQYRNSDTFFADNAQINLLADEIEKNVGDDLMNWNNINLPIFLADDGNFCPNWEDGSSCQKMDTNFICTIVNPRNKSISDASDVPNPLRSYCNNWIDENVLNLQTVKTADIVNANVENNKSTIGDQLDSFNKLNATSTDIINTIRNNNKLSTLQQYFLDNNSSNIYNKQYLIDNNTENIDKYNNDITTAYYHYKNNRSKIDKYKKYSGWLMWAIYVLGTALLITITLNILFSRVAS